MTFVTNGDTDFLSGHPATVCPTLETNYDSRETLKFMSAFNSVTQTGSARSVYSSLVISTVNLCGSPVVQHTRTVRCS